MKAETDVEGKEKATVCCIHCRYFSYFPNEEGHNTPHALGKCRAKPWDGNKGQWPMLEHPCKNFAPSE